VGGVGSLCCFEQSSLELGFNSLTSYFDFVFICSCYFCSKKLGYCRKFSLLSNRIGNLICMSFVHICHVLKIESQHIHNWQTCFKKINM